MILPRAYSFIYSRVSVSFPFLWTRKIQGAALLRARIGIYTLCKSVNTTFAALLRARVLVAKLFILRLPFW